MVANVAREARDMAMNYAQTILLAFKVRHEILFLDVNSEQKAVSLIAFGFPPKIWVRERMRSSADLAAQTLMEAK